MDNGEVGTRHFKQRGWNYDEWCLFLIGVKNIKNGELDEYYWFMLMTRQNIEILKKGS